MYKEVLAKEKMILSEDHPFTLTIMYNLAEIYVQQDHMIKAAKKPEEVLAKTKVIFSKDHSDMLMSMNTVAEMT